MASHHAGELHVGVVRVQLGAVLGGLRTRGGRGVQIPFAFPLHPSLELKSIAFESNNWR